MPPALPYRRLRALRRLTATGIAAAGIAAAGMTATGMAATGMTATGTQAAPAGRTAGAYRLQMPGDFHGNEPVARDGQRWLALRVDAEGRARLEQTRLQVSAVEDPILDGPGQATGRRVQADGAESLAFLRGPALRGGPVDTAQVESLGLGGLPDARIVLAGHTYRLQTECAPFAPAPDGFPQMRLSPHCRVLLYRGDARAVLMEAPATRIRTDDGTEYTSFGNDATPALLFAGDLDRDGQLDLLFDVSDHSNLQRPTLFLSSPVLSSPVLSSPALSSPVLTGRALSRPGLSAPAPSGPSTPPPPTLQDDDDPGRALPLRAVANYDALGC